MGTLALSLPKQRSVIVKYCLFSLLRFCKLLIDGEVHCVVHWLSGFCVGQANNVFELCLYPVILLHLLTNLVAFKIIVLY